LAKISALNPLLTFVNIKSSVLLIKYTSRGREREREKEHIKRERAREREGRLNGNDFSARALGDLCQHQERRAADHIYRQSESDSVCVRERVHRKRERDRVHRERERARARERDLSGNDFSARALGDLGQLEEWCSADEIYIHKYGEYRKS